MRLACEADAYTDLNNLRLWNHEQNLCARNPLTDDIFMRPDTRLLTKLSGEIHPREASGASQIRQSDGVGDVISDISLDTAESPGLQFRGLASRDGRSFASSLWCLT
jgi:hypothetical protein